MGTCIGIGNYRSFYCFLFSTTAVSLMFSYLNACFVFSLIDRPQQNLGSPQEAFSPSSASGPTNLPFPLMFSLLHLYPLTLFISAVTLQQLIHSVRGFTLNEAVNVRKSRYSNYLTRMKTSDLYRFPGLDYLPWISKTHCFRLPFLWKLIGLGVAAVKNLTFFIILSPSVKRMLNAKFDGDTEGRRPAAPAREEAAHGHGHSAESTDIEEGKALLGHAR